MTLPAADLDRVMIALRAGATLTFGGSRAHITYGFENGTWYREEFDEGAIAYHAIAEREILERIAERPESVQPLLCTLIWREFQSAYATGNAELARVRLMQWRDRGGDPDQAAILSAVLDGPDTPPSDEVKALIRARIRDRIAFHLIMDTLGWDLAPASAQRGLILVDRLLAISGDDSEAAFELRDRLRSLADAPVDSTDTASHPIATPAAGMTGLTTALTFKP